MWGTVLRHYITYKISMEEYNQNMKLSTVTLKSPRKNTGKMGNENKSRNWLFEKSNTVHTDFQQEASLFKNLV